MEYNREVLIEYLNKYLHINTIIRVINISIKPINGRYYIKIDFEQNEFGLTRFDYIIIEKVILDEFFMKRRNKIIEYVLR